LTENLTNISLEESETATRPTSHN